MSTRLVGSNVVRMMHYSHLSVARSDVPCSGAAAICLWQLYIIIESTATRAAQLARLCD